MTPCAAVGTRLVSGFVTFTGTVGEEIMPFRVAALVCIVSLAAQAQSSQVARRSKAMLSGYALREGEEV